MTFDWAEWGPPLAVLGAGLIIGAWLVGQSRSSARDTAIVTGEGARNDLEARHADVVRALKDLELEKAKLSEADYTRERQALLAKGAAALRQLDAAEPAPAAGSETEGATEAGRDGARAAAGVGGAAALGGAAAGATAPRLSTEIEALLEAERQRLGDDAFRAALAAKVGRTTPRETIAPEWKGAFTALAAVALVALLAWFASGDAVLRREGGSMTGNQDLGGAPAEVSQPSADEAALMARLETDPNDLEALNRLTIVALSRQDVPGAMQWNERALGVAADDVDARTNRAVLAAMMNMPDRALELLDEVLADEPEHALALVYKGLISLEVGKAEAAIPALEKALEIGAANPTMLKQELARARRMAAGEPEPTAPETAATGAAAGGPGATGGPAETVVAGTITLDPSAEAARAQAKVLFVSVRDPAGGPPLAAKNLPAGPFPMAFTITTADKLMMGGDRPFPATMDLTVRLDFDGNATTRSDGEPAAALKGIAAGTEGIEAVLR